MKSVLLCAVGSRDLRSEISAAVAATAPPATPVSVATAVHSIGHPPPPLRLQRTTRSLLPFCPLAACVRVSVCVCVCVCARGSGDCTTPSPDYIFLCCSFSAAVVAGCRAHFYCISFIRRIFHSFFFVLLFFFGGRGRRRLFCLFVFVAFFCSVLWQTLQVSFLHRCEIVSLLCLFMQKRDLEKEIEHKDCTRQFGRHEKQQKAGLTFFCAPRLLGEKPVCFSLRFLLL